MSLQGMTRPTQVPWALRLALAYFTGDAPGIGWNWWVRVSVSPVNQ